MAREEIRLQFGKYNGAEHGCLDLVVLGRDSHGLWLGGSPAKVARPGGRPVQWFRHVVLVPDDVWWVATFHSEPPQGSDLAVYVDITTPATVDQGKAFAVDLDLDVIKRTSGAVELDDEDEFEQHVRAMRYPPQVVAAARNAADTVVTMVRANVAPFDGTHKSWLAVL